MSKITYKKVGDIYIPNIGIKNNKTVNLGKYGLMRLNYLKENEKGIYTVMKMNGTLQKQLVEIDKKGRRMENEIIKKSAQADNINEKLKKKDQMKWVGLMNEIRNQAEEIILHKLIYD